MKRGYRVWALGAVVSFGGAAAALAGCTAIVNAGDYKVGSDGGVSSDSSVADAGTDGSRDSSAVHMDSGMTLSCGPSSLPTGSATFQNIVASCLLAGSCDPFLFQTTISTCISENYLQSVQSPSDSCLSTISDCAGYASCTKQSLPTAAQCPSGKPAYCDTMGNAINCGQDNNAGSYVKNCVTRGQKCQTYADGDAGTIADCVIAGGCADTDGLQHCDTSNNIYTCIGGVKYGDSCDPLGATCSETGSLGTSCYFNGTACKTPGYTCGTNDVAQWCTDGNVLFKFNCSAAGLTCALDDAGTADCVAPGCSVDDFNNCTESCASDGHTANLCVGGAQLAVDCKTYGFKSCSTDPTSGQLYCL